MAIAILACISTFLIFCLTVAQLIYICIIMGIAILAGILTFLGRPNNIFDLRLTVVQFNLYITMAIAILAGILSTFLGRLNDLFDFAPYCGTINLYIILAIAILDCKLLHVIGQPKNVTNYILNISWHYQHFQGGPSNLFYFELNLRHAMAHLFNLYIFYYGDCEISWHISDIFRDAWQPIRFCALLWHN